MNFKLLGEHLTPAEGELTVRAYHCTSLASRLLSLKAKGYLTITNKRVVFYAHGSSYAGKSVLHSEVPIADVSGINTYKGTYFSIGHFLGALIVSFWAGIIISAIVSGLVTLIVNLLASEFDFESTQVIAIILGILGLVAIIRSAAYPKDKIWRPILAASGASLLGGLGGVFEIVAGLFGGDGGLRTLLLGLLLGLRTLLLIGGFFAGIYAIITLFWYARRETISLTVGSKGGSSTPIAISGIPVFGLFNTAALRALNAEPAQDAETMISELGAVINDIQTLGDLGIQKWAGA
ncbi:MAG: hypothetical protein MN733_10575 [Nitrososphaera sp.]|nr:hypothetical protein [Nitrososphaera sp.]